MARILGVGIATLDIVNHVEHYPAEDAEVRALSQEVRRGGNVANTLVVLSQLGHDTRWAGTLADDSDSATIRADLARYGIDTRHVELIPGGHAPTSYIALSRQNGSRTIVHYRDLPEYRLEAFLGIDLTALDWLHFEGRNVTAVAGMLRHARRQRPELPLSVEIEKPREGIERLREHADLLIYSRHYALWLLGAEAATAADAAATFLRRMQRQAPQADHVCSWGGHGAFGLRAGEQRIHHAAATTPARVVDTIGAGDTFNAALIHARLAGREFPEGLHDACRLAGRKVGQQGFHGLATNQERA